MRKTLILLGLLVPLTLMAPVAQKVNKKNIEKAKKVSIELRMTTEQIERLCDDVLFFVGGKIVKGGVTVRFDSTTSADSCLKHLLVKVLRCDSLNTELGKLLK